MVADNEKPTDDKPADENEKPAGPHYWHSIELPDGTIHEGTKPIRAMRIEYDRTFGNLDLTGKSVLDLGTWSGAFAVEAAKRGAKFVTAVDYPTWRHPVLRGREAFDYITSQFPYDIRPLEFNIDTSPLSFEPVIEPHDFVLFLGVFYHLRDPIAALREIYKVTREALVVETYVENRLPADPPAMVFFPGKELRNDASNWWGPNIACVRALLKMVGFSRVEDKKGIMDRRHFFYAYK